MGGVQEHRDGGWVYLHWSPQHRSRHTLAVQRRVEGLLIDVAAVGGSVEEVCSEEEGRQRLLHAAGRVGLLRFDEFVQVVL